MTRSKLTRRTFAAGAAAVPLAATAAAAAAHETDAELLELVDRFRRNEADYQAANEEIGRIEEAISARLTEPAELFWRQSDRDELEIWAKPTERFDGRMWWTSKQVSDWRHARWQAGQPNAYGEWVSESKAERMAEIVSAFDRWEAEQAAAAEQSDHSAANVRLSELATEGRRIVYAIAETPARTLAGLHAKATVAAAWGELDGGPSMVPLQYDESGQLILRDFEPGEAVVCSIVRDVLAIET